MTSQILITGIVYTYLFIHVKPPIINIKIFHVANILKFKQFNFLIKS